MGEVKRSTSKRSISGSGKKVYQWVRVKGLLMEQGKRPTSGSG